MFSYHYLDIMALVALKDSCSMCTAAMFALMCAVLFTFYGLMLVHIYVHVYKKKEAYDRDRVMLHDYYNKNRILKNTHTTKYNQRNNFENGLSGNKLLNTIISKRHQPVHRFLHVMYPVERLEPHDKRGTGDSARGCQNSEEKSRKPAINRKCTVHTTDVKNINGETPSFQTEGADSMCSGNGKCMEHEQSQMPHKTTASQSMDASKDETVCTQTGQNTPANFWQATSEHDERNDGSPFKISNDLHGLRSTNVIPAYKSQMFGINTIQEESAAHNDSTSVSLSHDVVHGQKDRSWDKLSQRNVTDYCDQPLKTLSKQQTTSYDVQPQSPISQQDISWSTKHTTLTKAQPENQCSNRENRYNQQPADQDPQHDVRNWRDQPPGKFPNDHNRQQANHHPNPLSPDVVPDNKEKSSDPSKQKNPNPLLQDVVPDNKEQAFDPSNQKDGGGTTKQPPGPFLQNCTFGQKQLSEPMFHRTVNGGTYETNKQVKTDCTGEASDLKTKGDEDSSFTDPLPASYPEHVDHGGNDPILDDVILPNVTNSNVQPLEMSSQYDFASNKDQLLEVLSQEGIPVSMSHTTLTEAQAENQCSNRRNMFYQQPADQKSQHDVRNWGDQPPGKFSNGHNRQQANHHPNPLSPDVVSDNKEKSSDPSKQKNPNPLLQDVVPDNKEQSSDPSKQKNPNPLSPDVVSDSKEQSSDHSKQKNPNPLLQDVITDIKEQSSDPSKQKDAGGTTKQPPGPYLQNSTFGQKHQLSRPMFHRIVNVNTYETDKQVNADSTDEASDLKTKGDEDSSCTDPLPASYPEHVDHGEKDPISDEVIPPNVTDSKVQPLEISSQCDFASNKDQLLEVLSQEGIPVSVSHTTLTGAQPENHCSNRENRYNQQPADQDPQHDVRNWRDQPPGKFPNDHNRQQANHHPNPLSPDVVPDNKEKSSDPSKQKNPKSLLQDVVPDNKEQAFDPSNQKDGGGTTKQPPGPFLQNCTFGQKQLSEPMFHRTVNGGTYETNKQVKTDCTGEASDLKTKGDEDSSFTDPLPASYPEHVDHGGNDPILDDVILPNVTNSNVQPLEMSSQYDFASNKDQLLEVLSQEGIPVSMSHTTLTEAQAENQCSNRRNMFYQQPADQKSQHDVRNWGDQPPGKFSNGHNRQQANHHPNPLSPDVVSDNKEKSSDPSKQKNPNPLLQDVVPDNKEQSSDPSKQKNPNPLSPDVVSDSKEQSSDHSKQKNPNPLLQDVITDIKEQSSDPSKQKDAGGTTKQPPGPYLQNSTFGQKHQLSRPMFHRIVNVNTYETDKQVNADSTDEASDLKTKGDEDSSCTDPLPASYPEHVDHGEKDPISDEVIPPNVTDSKVQPLEISSQCDFASNKDQLLEVLSQEGIPVSVSHTTLTGAQPENHCSNRENRYNQQPADQDPQHDVRNWRDQPPGKFPNDHNRQQANHHPNPLSPDVVPDNKEKSSDPSKQKNPNPLLQDVVPDNKEQAFDPSNQKDGGGTTKQPPGPFLQNCTFGQKQLSEPMFHRTVNGGTYETNKQVKTDCTGEASDLKTKGDEDSSFTDPLPASYPEHVDHGGNDPILDDVILPNVTNSNVQPLEMSSQYDFASNKDQLLEVLSQEGIPVSMSHTTLTEAQAENQCSNRRNMFYQQPADQKSQHDVRNWGDQPPGKFSNGHNRQQANHHPNPLSPDVVSDNKEKSSDPSKQKNPNPLLQDVVPDNKEQSSDPSKQKNPNPLSPDVVSDSKEQSSDHSKQKNPNPLLQDVITDIKEQSSDPSKQKDAGGTTKQPPGPYLQNSTFGQKHQLSRPMFHRIVNVNTYETDKQVNADSTDEASDLKTKGDEDSSCTDPLPASYPEHVDHGEKDPISDEVIPPNVTDSKVQPLEISSQCDFASNKDQLLEVLSQEGIPVSVSHTTLTGAQPENHCSNRENRYNQQPADQDPQHDVRNWRDQPPGKFPNDHNRQQANHHPNPLSPDVVPDNKEKSSDPSKQKNPKSLLQDVVPDNKEQAFDPSNQKDGGGTTKQPPGPFLQNCTFGQKQLSEPMFHRTVNGGTYETNKQVKTDCTGEASDLKTKGDEDSSFTDPLPASYPEHVDHGGNDPILDDVILPNVTNSNVQPLEMSSQYDFASNKDQLLEVLSQEGIPVSMSHTTLTEAQAENQCSNRRNMFYQQPADQKSQHDVRNWGDQPPGKFSNGHNRQQANHHPNPLSPDVVSDNKEKSSDPSKQKNPNPLLQDVVPDNKEQSSDPSKQKNPNPLSPDVVSDSKEQSSDHSKQKNPNPLLQDVITDIKEQSSDPSKQKDAGGTTKQPPGPYLQNSTFGQKHQLSRPMFHRIVNVNTYETDKQVNADSTDEASDLKTKGDEDSSCTDPLPASYPEHVDHGEKDPISDEVIPPNVTDSKVQPLEISSQCDFASNKDQLLEVLSQEGIPVSVSHTTLTGAQPENHCSNRENRYNQQPADQDPQHDVRNWRDQPPGKFPNDHNRQQANHHPNPLSPDVVPDNKEKSSDPSKQKNPNPLLQDVVPDNKEQAFDPSNQKDGGGTTKQPPGPFLQNCTFGQKQLSEPMFHRTVNGGTYETNKQVKTDCTGEASDLKTKGDEDSSFTDPLPASYPEHVDHGGNDPILDDVILPNVTNSNVQPLEMSSQYDFASNKDQLLEVLSQEGIPVSMSHTTLTEAQAENQCSNRRNMFYQQPADQKSQHDVRNWGDQPPGKFSNGHNRQQANHHPNPLSPDVVSDNKEKSSDPSKQKNPNPLLQDVVPDNKEQSSDPSKQKNPNPLSPDVVSDSKEQSSDHSKQKNPNPLLQDVITDIKEQSSDPSKQKDAGGTTKQPPGPYLQNSTFGQKHQLSRPMFHRIVNVNTYETDKQVNADSTDEASDLKTKGDEDSSCTDPLPASYPEHVDHGEKDPISDEVIPPNVTDSKVQPLEISSQCDFASNKDQLLEVLSQEGIPVSVSHTTLTGAQPENHCSNRENRYNQQPADQDPQHDVRNWRDQPPGKFPNDHNRQQANHHPNPLSPDVVPDNKEKSSDPSKQKNPNPLLQDVVPDNKEQAFDPSNQKDGGGTTKQPPGPFLQNCTFGQKQLSEPMFHRTVNGGTYETNKQVKTDCTGEASDLKTKGDEDSSFTDPLPASYPEHVDHGGKDPILDDVILPNVTNSNVQPLEMSLQYDFASNKDQLLEVLSQEGIPVSMSHTTLTEAQAENQCSNRRNMFNQQPADQKSQHDVRNWRDQPPGKFSNDHNRQQANHHPNPLSPDVVSDNKEKSSDPSNQNQPNPLSPDVVSDSKEQSSDPSKQNNPHPLLQDVITDIKEQSSDPSKQKDAGGTTKQPPGPYLQNSTFGQKHQLSRPMFHRIVNVNTYETDKQVNADSTDEASDLKTKGDEDSSCTDPLPASYPEHVDHGEKDPISDEVIPPNVTDSKVQRPEMSSQCDQNLQVNGTSQCTPSQLYNPDFNVKRSGSLSYKNKPRCQDQRTRHRQQEFSGRNDEQQQDNGRQNHQSESPSQLPISDRLPELSRQQEVSVHLNQPEITHSLQHVPECQEEDTLVQVHTRSTVNPSEENISVNDLPTEATASLNNNMQSVAGSVLQDDISSQFIQLNDSVRLGNTIMIHYEDQQDVQHSRNWHPRQQQRHIEGRRHRHALRPWDEDYVHALRGPVIYLRSAATGRTVFATGSTRPLGRDTVDETYLSHEYMMCIVCRNRPVDAQLQPCCHTIYCHECAVSQPFCRMCGQLVEDFIIQ